MSKNITLIINPASAASKTKHRIPELIDAFEAAFGRISVRLTERSGHATQLTKDVLRSGSDVVVAVGGDGTLNEVVNGFFDRQGALVSRFASLAVVPSGTGGDFKRSLGVLDLKKTISNIKNNNLRSIDIGRVSSENNPNHRRYFINIASCGVSGEIAKACNESSKLLGGKLSYLIGTLRGLAGYKPSDLEIETNQKENLKKAVMVAVANGRFFGGGMHIAPKASLEDGLLDVIQISNAGLPFFIRHGHKIYSGNYDKLDVIKSNKCKSLTLRPKNKETILVETDGEIFGHLPVKFEVLEKKISIYA